MFKKTNGVLHKIKVVPYGTFEENQK